jgi:hypothetical protein
VAFLGCGRHGWQSTIRVGDFRSVFGDKYFYCFGVTLSGGTKQIGVDLPGKRPGQKHSQNRVGKNRAHAQAPSRQDCTALSLPRSSPCDTVLAVAKLGGPELLDSAMVSAVAFEQTDLARLLIAQGGRARPSERGTASSSTILGLLAAKGATELIEIMVEAGAEPNRVDGEGRYPLTSAARAGRADGVRLLLNVGSEIDATNKDGRTALSHAIEKGWREVVRILLAAGADTERPNSSGQTALLEVAPTSRTSLLSTLLEWKADVNARDTSGRSALMVAAEAGRLDNVRVLLSHEQDLDAKDKEGRTAEDYASVRRRNDIIEAIQVAKRKR